MEEKAANEMEMAAQENKEREKIEEAAQGWISKILILEIIKKSSRKLYKDIILSFSWGDKHSNDG